LFVVKKEWSVLALLKRKRVRKCHDEEGRKRKFELKRHFDAAKDV